MKNSEKKKIAVGVCGTVFRSFLIFTVISCLLSMVLYQIFVVSAWLTFVFVMFASVTRTEKKIEKKTIAVGVSGTVFRSFLIFTVISCLVSMILYQIFVLSAWLTFVFFMFVSVSRTEKKIEKKKNRRRWWGGSVMMAWARYLMLVVFENFLQFFFRFLPLCVRMSY